MALDTADVGDAVGRCAGAEIVVVAAPVVGRLLVVGADRRRQAAAGDVEAADPARRHAAEGPVEIDHAARMRRVGLGADRNRLILNGRPLAGINRKLQRVLAKTVLVIEAALRVVDALARIEGERRVIAARRIPGRAFRIRLVFAPLHALWVVRRLVEAARDEGQLAVLARPESQLDQALLALGRTVLAVAVGREARGVEHVADAADLALGADVGLPGAVAAGGKARFDRGRALAVRREQLDDAAGMVAVDRRKRPAHDFDALGAIQVEGRRLALAVRHRGRDAVGDKADAAHTEGGAGAEAARGNLQVLRVVLAVLHIDPGHPGQCLGDIDPRLIGTDFAGIDDVDRRRQIETAVLDPATCDHHRIERQLGIGDGVTGKGGSQEKNEAFGHRVHDVALGEIVSSPASHPDRRDPCRPRKQLSAQTKNRASGLSRKRTSENHEIARKKGRHPPVRKSTRHKTQRYVCSATAYFDLSRQATP